MDLTDFLAKYYANELTRRRSSDSMDKLAGAVAAAQDGADRQRDRLITEIERKLQQRLKTANLFTIRWSLS